MSNSTSDRSGDEIFIVDNSDPDWKTREYLREWAEFARSIDIATGYFEIGALLALDGYWQKLDNLRILMGDEVTQRTQAAILAGLRARAERVIDESIEREKEKNDFLTGVGAIMEAIHSGKIACRVYAKRKFHAKAYINHSRSRVIGSRALVGSSNFTYPGLTDNIELNLNIRSEVDKLQAWFDEHWEQSEDVSADILKVIQRHTHEYSPFEVYARSLRELMRHHVPDVEEWEKTQSKIFPILAKYQQEGYASLMQVANKYRGAFLCDGVGLGKTFIGMMVIERLLHDRKKVVLLSPKAAREPVWEATLRNYLPHAFGAWGGLRLFSHTDLGREGKVDDGSGMTWDELWDDVALNADAFVIDEAHHFRNPGSLGEAKRRESRYRKLARIARGKQVFLLTATPVNNSLRDFQHMIELFSDNRADYFGSSLGVHSLPTFFSDLEKKLEREVRGLAASQQSEPAIDTDEIEAEAVLRDSKIFEALVVQRSRTYARDSQMQEAHARGESGDKAKIFPEREDPKVAAYSVKKTYGKLLQMVEDAFNGKNPLFALAIYYPLAYAKPEEKARLLAADKRVENQQKQVVGLIRTNFLKRFESSTCAFESSCARLMLKLLNWVEDYAQTEAEQKRLERWKRDNDTVLEYFDLVLPGARAAQAAATNAKAIANAAQNAAQKDVLNAASEAADAASEDDATPEMESAAGPLSRKDYKVDEILEDCFNDLNQIADFLNELRKFKPANDDKLRCLKELLKKELKDRKVLIFTQFSDTAKYLQNQLNEAGFEGVDEIDSGSKNARNEIIGRFAPYYNGLSLPRLKELGWKETQILISTDVLSEGLNLQDATRLINYDLHWNPVRLMQRIGRVDRRMNPDIEAQIVHDTPRLFAERGDNNKVAFWNFLPPDELNELLTLYKRVTHKTLRISKTLGIEGRKLLTPDDDYDALKDFTHILEGDKSPLESLSLEWQALQIADEQLPAKIDALPGRLFSGKAHPRPGSRAVFFCYILPTKDATRPEGEQWTHDGGAVLWLLFDLATEKVLDAPAQIAEYIRATPDTPRRTSNENTTLTEVRRKVETQLKNTHEKSLGAPPSHKSLLRCWMEVL